MKKTGSIIENVVPYPNLTALENMELIASFKGGTKENSEACLKRVGMEKFMNEKTKNFSLGMKQRSGLCHGDERQGRRIMILDDP